MNENDLKQRMKGLEQIRMTDAEKKAVLEKIFATPIASPYAKHIRTPVYAYVNKLKAAAFLMIVVLFGSGVYASETSIPGDFLYPVKTKVVEPMLDIVNVAPERKIAWTEKKVSRRIAEAEKLAEKDELDDARTERLEEDITLSSKAFVEAVNVAAASTTVSTSTARVKAANLKKEFRKKIVELDKKSKEEEKNKIKDDDETSGSSSTEIKIEQTLEIKVEKTRGKDKSEIKKEKLERLRSAAIRVLDEDDREDEERSGESDGEDRD